MSSQRYPPEFKDEAVRQVLERGYTVAEVSQRLGVSAHSLYKWVKAVKPDKSDAQAAELVEAKSEILRLRAQMRRIEEERDILKKAAVSSTPKPCVACSRWPAAAFINGCISRCRIGPSMTSDCWRRSRLLIRAVLVFTAPLGYF